MRLLQNCNIVHNVNYCILYSVYGVSNIQNFDLHLTSIIQGTTLQKADFHEGPEHDTHEWNSNSNKLYSTVLYNTFIYLVAKKKKETLKIKKKGVKE